MMDPMATRREFLASSCYALGGAWLAVHLPAIEAAGAYARLAATQNREFEVFTAQEARAFAAFAERILPTDDTPGAREAGVVHFADRALSSFGQPMLLSIRAGLADLEARTKAKHRRAAEFASLTPRQQDGLIRTMEDAVFFENGRLLTVMGMFADPSYGGNQGSAGWRLIGFEERGAYRPPFGYYDAEYERQRAGGAR
ncbi:MAG: gluconate 2-dehydrogenase subunit 3 family protein [Longimicrobiales bacterium]